jgi:hypothetical protein
VRDLAVQVVDGRAEPYAAAPTIVLRLSVTEPSGEPVHAIALRAQVRIEPQRRRYSDTEGDRLLEMFGERGRWGESLRPFAWCHVSTTVPAFTGCTEVDLPVPVTYDFEVAGAKYLHALEEGEVPLVLLFNGTVFSRRGDGLAVEPVPWHVEAPYRLPVSVWRDVMDLYFPNSGWIRLQRDTIDALARYKAERALPSWEQVVEQLLKEAGA